MLNNRPKEIRFITLKAQRGIGVLSISSLLSIKSIGRWITDMDNAINSTQNGFLLDSDVHRKFAQYFTSVNPDDGYKVCLTSMVTGMMVEFLTPCAETQPIPTASDQLLRWHFRLSASLIEYERGRGADLRAWFSTRNRDGG